MTRKYANTLLPLNTSGLYKLQMLENFGANETYILYFLPPLYPKIVPALLMGADIY